MTRLLTLSIALSMLVVAPSSADANPNALRRAARSRLQTTTVKRIQQRYRDRRRRFASMPHRTTAHHRRALRRGQRRAQSQSKLIRSLRQNPIDRKLGQDVQNLINSTKGQRYVEWAMLHKKTQENIKKLRKRGRRQMRRLRARGAHLLHRLGALLK